MRKLFLQTLSQHFLVMMTADIFMTSLAVRMEGVEDLRMEFK
jgi:hypothetical protein